MLLKIGSKGADVEMLQAYLNHYNLGENPLSVSGTFDAATQQALIKFQLDKGLTSDGIYGSKSDAALQDFISKSKKFIVSIHGGHGGMNLDGTYATPANVGKKYQHKAFGVNLHGDGWFYEGHENRIAANEVAKQLRLLGIFVLVTHDQIKDDYGNLSRHIKLTTPYIKLGYKGYTHAFHSNAVSTHIEDANGKFIRDRSQEELNKIQGCYVFTSKGNTFSDKVSSIHLNHLKNKFGTWVKLQTKTDMATENSDNEANFQILRDVENAALSYKNPFFGAILDEHGFMTSVDDCLFITQIETRKKRVDAAVNTALSVKELLFKPTI